MKVFIFFSFISLCVCSCYSPRYVYTPATQNIPLLHAKNELEFSAFYGGLINTFNERGNYNRGFDLHAAWAVTNHFAATISETVRWENNVSNDSYYANDTSLLSYKSNFTEFGVGYFTPARYNKKMQFQLFGGAAFGSSYIRDKYVSSSIRENKYHDSRVTKMFIQPAVIYSPVKNFSGALSSRFAGVIFTHIHTNYTVTELDNYILDSLTVSPVFFWEPAVSYTFGFKKIPVKLRLQGSICILLNRRFVEHRTGNIALGVTADIIKKKKAKKSVDKN